MLFKVNTSKDAVQVSGGGGSKYISKSGVYDATIVFASLDVSTGGAESVNFNIMYNGEAMTLYGPYVTSKAGKPLEIGLKLINNLAVIAGMTDGDEPTIEEEEHKVGRDNKLQTFAVITDFSDLTIKVRLQEEYSKYNDKISKRLSIKSFYTEDGASAEEVVNKTGAGDQLEKDQAYVNNITYRDDLTEADIAAWVAEKKGGAATTPAAKTVKKPGSLFK